MKASQRPSLRNSFLLGVFVAVLAVSLSGFLFIKHIQGSQAFQTFVNERMAETFGLEIEFDSISGDALGTIAVTNIHVSTPSPNGVTIFQANEVRFKYSLLDMLRENFSGWFDIILKKPIFYTNVPFSPKVPEARSLELFSGLTQHVKQNARLRIEDGTIKWLGRDGVLSGIEGIIEDESFNIQISLDHILIDPFDISSTLQIEGRIENDPKTSYKQLAGSIQTVGSVVNWKPIPEESVINFAIQHDRLVIQNSTILSGVEIEGYVGHSGNEFVEIKLIAEDYPAREIHDIISFTSDEAIGGRISGELFLSGSIYQPHIKGTLLIQNDPGEDERFKNMQLHFEGIYPEVKLSESRMVMPSGAVMNFSNKELHVIELLQEETYERLVRATEQNMVAWGDWTLRREDLDDSVSVEHSLSDVLRVRYERSEVDETQISDVRNENDLELEYLLGGKESFKLNVRDDESFFGLQRKTSF